MQQQTMAEDLVGGTATAKLYETTTEEKAQSIRDRTVRELLPGTRRLVEVPYTASLSHTMNALVANGVVAVPVAAPPGQWIGAGGSMIMESDKHTGVVRKHYIGMVTMLDILAHIAGNDQVNGGDGVVDATGFHHKMAVPVSTIIGHCLEGLSLWTLNPNTSHYKRAPPIGTSNLVGNPWRTVFVTGSPRKCPVLSNSVSNFCSHEELVANTVPRCKPESF